MGKIFTFYLQKGEVERLVLMSIDDQVKEKIQREKTNFLNGDILIQALSMDVFPYLLSPLISESDFREMGLMLLERNESFIVMTFAYNNNGSIVSIPDKGKLLYTVALRYNKPRDKTIFPKIKRKIANLPILRYISGRQGTAGRWIIIDYKYNYNLSDYSLWLINEGESYCQNEREKASKLIKRLNTQEGRNAFREGADWHLDSKHRWVALQIVNQIPIIEQSLKLIEFENDK